MRKTVDQIKEKKKSGKKIVMLTAYDYSLAAAVDSADIDIILIGDSLANVMLGLQSTTEVGMREMLHHAKAVDRAVKHALVVGDMPWESYQKNPGDAVKNARRFVDEAGCGAVKLEWFDGCLDVTKTVVAAGIPAMGHVGLTPQTADKLGGFKVQGKDATSAKQIIERAQALEQCGCFSIVLECIPDEIAKIITEKLTIPTIGIGAGVHCDGQVLVTHDMLGLFERYRPKFVKQYAGLAGQIREAVARFKSEVSEGKFPDKEHSYSIRKEEIDKLMEDKDK